MARRRVPIAQSDVVRGFAARLRERRVARGLTQADLARAAALTPAYVSRLEGGHIAPGIDLVERVAAALVTTRPTCSRPGSVRDVGIVIT